MPHHAQLLDEIFAGPDLYVDTARTNNSYPWDENYQPTPFMPSAQPFYDWGLYRLPQSGMDSKYFMSQETPQIVGGTTQRMPAGSTDSNFGHLGGGRSYPDPTSCKFGAPPPISESYRGEPLKAIHSQYTQKPLSAFERQTGGGFVFSQESVQCAEGCVSNLTVLGIFLLVGFIVTYAITLGFKF